MDKDFLDKTPLKAIKRLLKVIFNAIVPFLPFFFSIECRISWAIIMLSSPFLLGMKAAWSEEIKYYIWGLILFTMIFETIL